MSEQMTKEHKTYENYPAGIVLLSNTVALFIYGIGAYIVGGLGVPFAALYLLYCAWVEVMVLKSSCVSCYYYGKVCGFGKGKLSAMLFKKGEPRHFIERVVSWSDIMPDMLVLIIPLFVGIALAVKEFSWMKMILLAVLVLLSLGGNAVVRGSFVCKYCKQQAIGCSAEKMFNAKKG